MTHLLPIYLIPLTLMSALLVAAIIDLRHRLIHNEIVLVVVILAMLDKGFVFDSQLTESVLRAIGTLGILMIPYLRNIIGGGDVKLITALTFFNTQDQLLDFVWYLSLGYIVTVGILIAWWRIRPPSEKYKWVPLAAPILIGQAGVLLI